MLCVFGVWRSPVARTHGVREVRSSNLLTPTKQGAVLSEAMQFGLLLRSKRRLNESCFQGVAQLVAL